MEERTYLPCPKPRRGRRAYPLRVMRRMRRFCSFGQRSNPGMGNLLYEVESVRRFVGRRHSGALSDETTRLNFYHLWAWGDAGYQGAGRPKENRDAEVEWQVALKADKRRRQDEADVRGPALHAWSGPPLYAPTSPLVRLSPSRLGVHPAWILQITRSCAQAFRGQAVDSKFRPASVFFFPRVSVSPYFEGTQAAGAKAYSVYNHYFHPHYYSDPLEEYWAHINDVVMTDVTGERQIRIKGPDAFAFTDYLITRDLNKIQVSQCKYLCLCDDGGRIINDPVVARMDENEFWISISDSDVLLWTKGIAHHSKWAIEIDELDVSPMQIQGPKSLPLMVSVFGTHLDNLPYYHTTPATLSGMEMIITRTGFTGEKGFEIYLKNSRRDGMKLWNTMLEAGKPFDLRPTGSALPRRLEAGIRNFRQDITHDDNPYEVGLGFSVDLDKESDFIGKEALRRIKGVGIKRKLVGIEFGKEPMQGTNEEWWPVLENGSPIGKVTTAAYSPRLDKNIGFAMLPMDRTPVGTELKILQRGVETEAIVVKLPFSENLNRQRA